MLANLTQDLKNYLSNKEDYFNSINAVKDKYDGLYSSSKIFNNLELFYKNKFTFFPNVLWGGK